MLALSTVNCPILKIIKYCELCNTQDNFAHSNTLPYACCNSWHACTISKLCFTLIYSVLLPAILCGCNLHIATPHCIQLVVNIANHNRLENSSDPRNRERIKWDCTIVLQYIEFHLVSSKALSWRTIVKFSLLAYPPSASPHSFFPGIPPGLWLYCCFEGCLWAPVAFAKAWTSSDTL